MLDEENDMAGEGIRRRKKQNKINVKSTGPYRRLEVNALGTELKACPGTR
jgi:hypothetical protein